jgi:tRNA threonylcarbamoyladenosine biosynthesis protein TsaE
MELSFSLDEINDVANKILTNYPEVRHFAFYAEMGSGKTTLIRALCKSLGVKDNVSSPTFSIINEYQIEGSNTKVYHMDWYRLKNTTDAIEAGVQDILQQPNNYCFVEWPEIASELLTNKTQPFTLTITSPTVRCLKTALF